MITGRRKNLSAISAAWARLFYFIGLNGKFYEISPKGLDFFANNKILFVVRTKKVENQ